MKKDIQPIFILPEGTQRSQGKTAQSSNILAAKAVAETVRTTLGPKGMDKMLVDKLNDIIVTNDGVTILEEMQVEHPAAKMIVEIAKTQEDEVGDGTTTAVVLAGELLKKAEDLLDQDIHPTVLSKGFRLAESRCQQKLKEIAEPVTSDDSQMLTNIALTAMTGKGAEASKDHLAKIVVEAVKSVAETEEGKITIDPESIKVEKKVGSSVDESELVEGIIIDKERVHPGMPKIIKNPKIALVDSALEIKNTEVDAKIQITSPDQMKSFLDMEEQMLRDMIDKITTVGANVVICQKGIDDIAQHFLAKKGIYAIRRAKRADLEAISKATGAKIVTNLVDLSQEDMGSAGIVEQRRVGDEDMTFICKCQNPKAVTILVRGGTEHVVDEAKRAVDDAVGDVSAGLKSGKVVAGAGSIEIELAKDLRQYSASLSGREQLAVSAFADAIEVIPRTLAENSGLDPIDVITELKAAHESGSVWAGINVFDGKVFDALAAGVIEPLKIKTQAISSATEVSVMILRIDDIIASGDSGSSAQPQNMPEGLNMS